MVVVAAAVAVAVSSSSSCIATEHHHSLGSWRLGARTANLEAQLHHSEQQAVGQHKSSRLAAAKL